MRNFFCLILTIFAVSCSEKPASDNAAGNTEKTSESDKTLVIGFSQVGSESSWRTSFSESVKAEAAKRGIELKFSDAQQKQENQIAALRSFIARRMLFGARGW